MRSRIATAQAWGAIIGTRWVAIDCDNTRWLNQRHAKLGWFDIPIYSVEADEAAWHLVQHADREPEFQRSVLSYLQALPAGRTSPTHTAYLWDRVAGKDGKPQRFGTQGVCQPDGSWQPLPSEDPENLDACSAVLRMRPIAQHAALDREICPQPAAK